MPVEAQADVGSLLDGSLAYHQGRISQQNAEFVDLTSLARHLVLGLPFPHSDRMIEIDRSPGPSDFFL